MNNESKRKTFLVATILCIVCAIVVSSSSVALKGMQQENKLFDEQVNILKAAGLVEARQKVDDATVDGLFAAAQKLVVDLETGEYAEDTAGGSNFLIPLKKADDLAGIKVKPKFESVYAFNDENGALQTIVLPIKGTGLWSTMHGFISLNGDLKTVAHIVFYDHGETPGLGGEISNPVWTKKWEGKLAFDEKNEPIVRVIKGTVDPSAPEAASQVDGISGATLTGNGVTKTVAFWLGENGYGPFLAKLRDANAR